MPFVRSLLAAGAVAVFSAACASSGTMNSDTRRPSRSADVLTSLEIAERAPSATTAADAVSRLRSTWLRISGSTSLSSATPIRLYVNNTPRGNVDALATIAVDLVAEIRYYGPNDATMRWGTGHTTGAIEIVLGVVASRGAATPPAAGEGAGAAGETERAARPEDRPFTPKPIFFVHSGSSLFHTPTEKREVWLPQVNIGGGAGVHATRTVTVFAAVEYHYFGFSAASAMEYLMSSEFSPIKNPDGVELRGSGNSILSFTANVKFHPRYGFVRPYLLVGAGYARLNSGSFTVSGPAGALLPQPQFYLQSATGGGQVENTVLYGGGLGLDLELAKHFRLFVDGRYFETIRGPRYNDVWDRNQIINTRFAPFRLGVTYK